MRNSEVMPIPSVPYVCGKPPIQYDPTNKEVFENVQPLLDIIHFTIHTITLAVEQAYNLNLFRPLLFEKACVVIEL